MNEQALKERLKKIASMEKRTFNEVWRKLVLERFLVRIKHSQFSENFIFKGGLLLAHYIDIGRETKDIDFLATEFEINIQNMEKIFQEICSLNIQDGFYFSYSSITPLEQPHMNYPGYRINLNVKYAEKIKDRIQVDIGIGDVVEPKSELIKLTQYNGRPIFENSVSIKAYPVETIFAEKLETIISKGAANSRMKDYHDLLLICREVNILNISKLKNDISHTFLIRKTELNLPLLFSSENLDLMQKLWIGHRRGLGNFADILNIPFNIADLISEINQWIINNHIK